MGLAKIYEETQKLITKGASEEEIREELVKLIADPERMDLNVEHLKKEIGLQEEPVSSQEQDVAAKAARAEKKETIAAVREEQQEQKQEKKAETGNTGSNLNIYESAFGEIRDQVNIKEVKLNQLLKKTEEELEELSFVSLTTLAKEKKFYSVLGIEGSKEELDITQDWSRVRKQLPEIKKKWRGLALQIHPDKLGGQDTRNEIFNFVQNTITAIENLKGYKMLKDERIVRKIKYETTEEKCNRLSEEKTQRKELESKLKETKDSIAELTDNLITQKIESWLQDKICDTKDENCLLANQVSGKNEFCAKSDDTECYSPEQIVQVFIEEEILSGQTKSDQSNEM